ncbi:hypothetical protein [Haloechinothrix salitolerans]|uniref:Uncharacterized protein n=1 Tax=Haloechinothrix salitolerans TaxID=926830 RepID=A0ABW2C6C2_9PSEU
MAKDKPGRHDADRDVHGKPQPDKWSNAGDKDDGNKHGTSGSDKK